MGNEGMEDDGWGRADLSRAIWLLQRMDAQKHPIKAAQVERFGRHPAGPILPDSCVETRRLPVKYGMRIGLVIEGNMPVGPDLLLSATEDGKPCIGTIVDSQPTLFVGEKSYKLGEPEGRYHSFWVQKCICFELLGFRNGEPVTLIGTARLYSDTKRYYFGTVFQGEQICAEDVTVASLLSDGSLAYVEAHEEGPDIPPMCEGGNKLFRDGQFVCEIYVGLRFFLSPDGRLISMEKEGCPAIVEYVMPRTIDEEHYYLRDRAADLVMFRGSLHWVETQEEGRDAYSWYAAPFGSNSELTWGVRLGKNPYLSHLTALDDERFAYIGETTRDKMECWVVDGVEQLGFDHVSPLFRRGEDCLYWGAVGRHLCLMEIPRP